MGCRLSTTDIDPAIIVILPDTWVKHNRRTIDLYIPPRMESKVDQHVYGTDMFQLDSFIVGEDKLVAKD